MSTNVMLPHMIAIEMQIVPTERDRTIVLVTPVMQGMASIAQVIPLFTLLTFHLFKVTGRVATIVFPSTSLWFVHINFNVHSFHFLCTYMHL